MVNLNYGIGFFNDKNSSYNKLIAIDGKCKFHLLIKILIHTNLKMHIKLNIILKCNNDVIKNYNPKLDIKVHMYN